MELSESDYFFYEYLICRGITLEQFANLSLEEYKELMKEYQEFEKSIK